MEIVAKGIQKRFFRKRGESNYFFAVRECDFLLPEGSVTVLTGHSGSGKTTLLSMLAGLLAPDTGEVTAAGRGILSGEGPETGAPDGFRLYGPDDRKNSAFRCRHLAVVPQGRAVLDTLNVTDNCLLGLRLAGRETPESPARAEAWLERFGISELRDAMPRELSGGELRRVMLIRALMTGAEVLFADEPTADLDEENTGKVLDVLRAAAHEENKAVLVVSHDPEAMPFADRVFRMNKGEMTPV